MNDCIFCSIAETTDHKHHVVWSDDSHVAFLTIGSVQKGTLSSFQKNTMSMHFLCQKMNMSTY